MAVDTYLFGTSDLVLVGGDYGEIRFAGSSEEARRALEQIVDAARCGSNKLEHELVVRVVLGPPVVVETRHAGREGTPERGVAASTE